MPVITISKRKNKEGKKERKKETGRLTETSYYTVKFHKTNRFYFQCND